MHLSFLRVFTLRWEADPESCLQLQALIFSIAVPLLYRLNHLSVSPNFNNICFKGFTPMLAVILSPILGPGVVAAGLIVPLYAIGMWLQTKVSLCARLLRELFTHHVTTLPLSRIQQRR